MSEDFLYLTSDLGDPVGEGVIRSLDYSNARFLVASDTSRSRATLQVRSAGEDWTVTLMAPLGQELDVGSYDSAQRSPDNLTAGIDVRGNGRACVETFGTFTISAITFEPDGHLQILEAEFDQNCELPDAPALHGTLIYRAPPPGG